MKRNPSIEGLFRWRYDSQGLINMFTKKYAPIVSKCILISAIALLVEGCSETWDRSFTNFEELQNAKMVGSGWAPKNLPTDATQIEIEGDLDSGLSLGRFVSHQADSIRLNCSKEDSSNSFPYYAQRWLRQKNEDPTTLKVYESFLCPSDGFHVALRPGSVTAFWWKLPQ